MLKAQPGLCAQGLRVPAQGREQRGGRGFGLFLLLCGQHGHGAQRIYILLCAPGVAHNALRQRLLRGRQAVLAQKLGVAADDGEGRFQIVRQGGKLPAAQGLRLPLAVQRGRQLLPQAVHGGQGGGKFPHAGPALRPAFQRAGGNGAAGLGQKLRVRPQALCHAVRKPHHAAKARQCGSCQEHGLKIRQLAAQGRVCVGHGVVVLKIGHGAVRQRHGGVVLRVAPVAAAAAPGVQGFFQVPAVHVGAQHLRVCLRRREYGPAAQARQPAVGKAGRRVPGGHGGALRRRLAARLRRAE